MIGTEREDTRVRFAAELRVSFTQYASVAVTIKNSDYDSNLPTASYSDLVVGTESQALVLVSQQGDSEL